MKYAAIWRASLAGLALGALAILAARAQTTDPGTPEPVITVAAPSAIRADAPFTFRLGRRGDKVIRDVELDEAGYLVPRIVNQPPELGTVHFLITDAADKPVAAAGGAALKPGRYRIAISASGAADDEATVIVARLEPLDAFEPNDSRETATAVTLPFNATISLDAESAPDWFRITTPGAGVLSMRTHGGESNAPTRLVIYEDTKVIHQILGDGSDQAARYMFVSGAPIFLKIWSARPAAADSPARRKQITINFYPVLPGGTVVMGAIGIDPNSEAMRQMRAIAAATGARLIATTSPEEIRDALRTGIRGDGGPGGMPPVVPILVALALALALGGLWLMRDRLPLPAAWQVRCKADRAPAERIMLAQRSRDIGRRIGTLAQSAIAAAKGLVAGRRAQATARKGPTANK